MANPKSSVSRWSENYCRFTLHSANKLWLIKTIGGACKYYQQTIEASDSSNFKVDVFNKNLDVGNMNLDVILFYFQCNIHQNFIQVGVTNMNVDFGNIFLALQLQQAKTCEVNFPTVMILKNPTMFPFYAIFWLAIAHKFIHLSFSFCFLGSFI